MNNSLKKGYKLKKTFFAEEQYKKIPLDLADVMEEHGLLHPTERRNLEIRLDFSLLKQRGLLRVEAVEELSEKYCLAEITIKKILAQVDVEDRFLGNNDRPKDKAID